eukprot:3878805-Pyramimonas_sp.AAC.1
MVGGPQVGTAGAAFKLAMTARDLFGNADPSGNVTFVVGVNGAEYPANPEPRGSEEQNTYYVTALNVTRAGLYDLTASANGALFYQFPSNLRIVPAAVHLPST